MHHIQLLRVSLFFSLPGNLQLSRGIDIYDWHTGKRSPTPEMGGKDGDDAEESKEEEEEEEQDEDSGDEDERKNDADKEVQGWRS